MEAGLGAYPIVGSGSIGNQAFVSSALPEAVCFSFGLTFVLVPKCLSSNSIFNEVFKKLDTTGASTSY